MSCYNCQGCCIHSKIEEKLKKIEYKNEKGVVWMTGWEHTGYQHYCDKNPEGYIKWHEEHKNDTYDTYKNFPMDCYEPTETSKLLDEMLKTTEQILNKK